MGEGERVGEGVREREWEREWESERERELVYTFTFQNIEINQAAV